MTVSIASLKAENEALHSQLQSLKSSHSECDQKLSALKEYLRLSLDEKKSNYPDNIIQCMESSKAEISRLNNLIDTLQKENIRLAALIPHPHKRLKRTIISLFIFIFVIVIPLFVSYEEKFIQYSHHSINSHYNQATIPAPWADYPLTNIQTLNNVSDNQSLVPGTMFDPPIGRISDLKRANQTLNGNKQLIYSAYNAGKSCYVFVSGEPNSDGLDCMFGVLGTLLMSYEGLRGI